jgi:hypothetical protein
VTLARGKGRTENPRVYAGCLPCAQGRWVADLDHANRWIALHWKRCKHLPPAGGSEPSRAPKEAPA